MEKIIGTNHVKNEERLKRVNKESKANWVGHVLLRNCLVNDVIEGKIEVTGRRGRNRKLLLGIVKEKRRY